MIVGTPSGVTLAPEGGAHQSIGSPLIGMTQDGLAAFEPAFADELAVIMEWAFDYMQRDGEGDPDERTWLRDETGGSVYLRLTTNPIEQPGTPRRRGFPPGRHRRRLLAAQAGAELRGGDRLSGRRGARGDPRRRPARPRRRRDVGVLAVTSADRLNAGWTAAQRAPLARQSPGRRAMSRRCSHAAAALPGRHRHRRPSGDAGLARRSSGPPDDPARGRAFRPDRHDRRSLPPFRPRCRGDRRGGDRRPAGARRDRGRGGALGVRQERTQEVGTARR